MYESITLLKKLVEMTKKIVNFTKNIVNFAPALNVVKNYQQCYLDSKKNVSRNVSKTFAGTA